MCEIAVPRFVNITSDPRSTQTVKPFVEFAFTGLRHEEKSCFFLCTARMMTININTILARFHHERDSSSIIVGSNNTTTIGSAGLFTKSTPPPCSFYDCMLKNVFVLLRNHRQVIAQLDIIYFSFMILWSSFSTLVDAFIRLWSFLNSTEYFSNFKLFNVMVELQIPPHIIYVLLVSWVMFFICISFVRR